MEVEKRQDSKYNVTNLDSKEGQNLNLVEKPGENKEELEEEEEEGQEEEEEEEEEDNGQKVES